MAIIRGHIKATDNFTILPNHWLRDSRLSLKAIGLLAQVLSHSEGWSMSINSLAKANNVGKDAIRTAIVELEKAGYLHRQQPRNDVTNRFEESVWVTGEPLAEKPLAEKPSPGNPSSENPTPKKNNKQEEQFEEEKLEEYSFPQNEFEEGRKPTEKHWDEFLAWYVHYPNKTGKQAAFKAYVKALKKVSRQELLDGVIRFASDPNLPFLKSKIKHPATWLNAGCWDDEPLAAPIYSREELLDVKAAKNAIKRKKEIAATQAEILAERAKEERVKEQHIERCEHDRILAACPKCFMKYQ